MDATPNELTVSAPVRFSDSYWTTRWLVVGLAVLLLWRCAALIDRAWLAQFPWWLWLVLAGLFPQIFLLLFPIFTRRPRGRLAVPPLKRCWKELGIAVLIVICVLVAAGLVEYLLDRIWPGTSLTPDALKRLAESQPPWVVFALFSFAFTFAPIAEEIFFRGFLQNALSARMPVVIATLLQASIFGAAHSFGPIHSVEAAVMGVILAIVYKWRGTLVTPIFVHAGMNFVSALMITGMAIASANSPMLGVGGNAGDGICVVRQIVPNSAAEKAGLQVGDTIVLFNGQAIHDVPQLAELVRQYKVGDTIPVLIKREGAMIDINVVLQRRGG